MARRLFVSAVAMFGMLAAVWALSGAAHAASEPTKRVTGITISPAFQNVTLSPDKPGDAFDFSVTNNTSEPYEFSLAVQDFGSLDETGGVLFVGETERKLNYRYGLSEWATLEKDRIVVEPKRTEKVRVSIINKESLTPGGHYGAVLLTPLQSNDRPTKVQINQVLSSLLFVKKEGGEIYNFGLRSYEFERHVFSLPQEVQFRFQNAGNVHVIPRGTITVADPRGRLVSRSIINSGSAIILPETFRQIRVPVESVAASWLPGTYTMNIAYRFDGETREQTRTVSFVYVPIWSVLAALALAALTVATVLSRKFRRSVRAGLKKPLHLLKNRRG